MCELGSLQYSSKDKRVKSDGIGVLKGQCVNNFVAD